jgi:hypothetical protein
MASNSNPFSFLSGFVQDRNTGRVIAQIDDLKDAGATDSHLMKWIRSEGRWYSFDLEWHATRLCIVTSPELHLLAVGPAGIAYVGTAAGNAEEEIDPTDDGPRRRGDIRDLRIIGAHVYAAGMSRQVYRREGKGNWTRQDAGTVQPRGSLEVAGFNSIDGVSEADIYAVGFGGEIWRRVAGAWHQVESPTNVVLHRVRAVSDDLVFAAGQGGVLLRGSADRWDVVPQYSTDADFWGMEWFRDTLFVASDTGVYALTADDTLERVEMGLGDGWTTRHLHANDGVMWSFGPKHVAWTEDVTTWTDVTP